MIAVDKQKETAGTGFTSLLQWRTWLAMSVLSVLSLTGGMAWADNNAIESISASQQGANVIVKVTLKNPLTKPPFGFSVTNPARIALDFTDTENGTGKNIQDINIGDVRSANVVQAGSRSRLVFNLNRNLNYATSIEGNLMVITIDGSGGVATALNASGIPVTKPAAVLSDPVSIGANGKPLLRDIDFRRGVNGEGRIVIDLPNNQVGVDVRQQGQKIIVDLLKTSIPPTLRRRLDVGDFGTPVQTVTTLPQGDNVQMVIEPKGLWEHSAYQSETQLVIDVKPIQEDPNKLVQGTQGFRGEKLTLNFQSIDVRSVLQVIADFTGLNIITSDTVNGTVTLRLKDVPWDQALNIVMQAKGLDLRKDGNVLLIAPKDELLTKEKLELEQRAQIAELEPLRSEIFQLNYQKAESFRTVFGLENSGGESRGRVLSKRGNAVIDARTNQLFVNDIPSKLEEIRKLIQRTDIASKQVLIEARIVEARDDFSRSLGARLGFNDDRFRRGGDAGNQVRGNTRIAVSGNGQGVGDITGQSGVIGGFANSQFVNLPAATGFSGLPAGTVGISLFSAAANRFLNLELSALEAGQKGKVVSSPRVVTADKVPALIEQGEEIPFQTATSSGATAITFKKANLKLEVTPQITPDGNVILDVDVTKDSRGLITPGGFAIDNKHVRTQVLVENGGTVVLGGIYTQEETDAEAKVPFFGDLPLVGVLFKNKSRNVGKVELLIFITPKVVAERLAGK